MKKIHKCGFCTKYKLSNSNFTANGSNNKAEVSIDSTGYLTFYGDDGCRYSIQCNYCPRCGRKFLNDGNDITLP